VARFARVVIPNMPHHIVQRGNRRQTVFFHDEDRIYYLHLLRKYGEEAGLDYWAYCQMRNHIHLIAVPKTSESLAEAMAGANWKYALSINLREDWKGSLWQGRFYSCPLDHPHLIACTRYIERNPVRAKIIADPGDYPWSSAQAHLGKRSDKLIIDCALTEEIGDWAAFINQEDDAEIVKRLRKHLSTGRPLGDESFIEQLESMTGRIFKKQRGGRKPSTS
jgi:putative transposase